MATPRTVRSRFCSRRCGGLPGRVEGYRKNDTPARIAARFAELVREYRQGGMSAGWTPRVPRRPAFVGAPDIASLRDQRRASGSTRTGGSSEARRSRRACPGLLTDQDGKPALALPPAEFAAKDSELIACEIEYRRDGIDRFFAPRKLDLPDLPSAMRGEGAVDERSDRSRLAASIVQESPGVGTGADSLMLDYGTCRRGNYAGQGRGDGAGRSGLRLLRRR